MLPTRRDLRVALALPSPIRGSSSIGATSRRSAGLIGDRRGGAPRQPLCITKDSPPFVNADKGGAVTPRRGAGRAGQCVAGRAGGCWPSIALGSARTCSEPRSAPSLARGAKGSTASPRRPLPGFEGAESLASPSVIPWVCGTPEPRITARNHVSSIGTARSALLAVVGNLIPSCHNSRKDGVDWREFLPLCVPASAPPSRAGVGPAGAAVEVCRCARPAACARAQRDRRSAGPFVGIEEGVADGHRSGTGHPRVNRH